MYVRQPLAEDEMPDDVKQTVETIHDHFQRKATPEVWAEIDSLRYQRKWLIEQLAGALGWTEQEVSDRLFEDVCARARGQSQGD